MDYIIKIEEKITKFDEEKLANFINTYNFEVAGVQHEKIFISLKDKSKDELRGGLKAIGLCGSIYIQVFFIDKELRRRKLGEKILQTLEDFSTKSGYSILLVDSFSFQAVNFYMRNGFQTFSEFKLTNEISRFFLKKILN